MSWGTVVVEMGKALGWVLAALGLAGLACLLLSYGVVGAVLGYCEGRTACLVDSKGGFWTVLGWLAVAGAIWAAGAALRAFGATPPGLPEGLWWVAPPLAAGVCVLVAGRWGLGLEPAGLEYVAAVLSVMGACWVAGLAQPESR